MFPDDLQEKGSYYYRGNWNMLDNLVVSSGLLDDTGFKCIEQKDLFFSRSGWNTRIETGRFHPTDVWRAQLLRRGKRPFPVYFMLKR